MKEHVFAPYDKQHKSVNRVLNLESAENCLINHMLRSDFAAC